MKVAVIGAGSWGTAIAQLLAGEGNDVSLWARDPKLVESLNANHRNPRYLTDSLLHHRVVATADLREAIADAAAIAVVTPSSIMRSVAIDLADLVDKDTPIALCSKGVEEGSGLLGVEIFEAEMGNLSRLAVLSGPNHAEEVIRSIPSASVVASSDEACARFFVDLFASDTFRTYLADDVVGVELCAAFKNVIAISVGLSYGLGYGDNTAALLMTRGMAEMSRLVDASGGKPFTVMGLAGAGDLIATCTSQHSRNRTFGQALSLGTTLESYERETHMVVEGARACKTLQPLADHYSIELPITKVVREIVWEGRDPRRAAEALAKRPLTTEFWGLS